jgi:hypothetical protein
MGAVLEISYFNSIVLAGGKSGSSNTPGKYHIEESRINGEFNGKQMDYGVKAHITNEEYKSKVRENALTYSGIYNSRTNVNELNQFPSGEEITRAVDIAEGSIQKLHAEDTNLKLSRDGVTPISEAGMKDWFKDNLKVCNTIYGAYDEQKGKYCITLQSKDASNYPITNGVVVSGVNRKDFATLCYDEKVKGWTSFYTYKVTHGVSLNNDFYTFVGNSLYLQHSPNVPRSRFAGNSSNTEAFVDFVFNDKPEIVKTFLTINYEGTTGWDMQKFTTGGDAITGYNAYSDINECYVIPVEGTQVGSETIGFVRKEGFYFSELKNKARDFFQDNSHFNTTGVKGYFADVRMQYYHPQEGVQASKAELFSVSSEVIV